MTPPIHIDLVPIPDPFTGTVVVDVVARTDGESQRIVAADIAFGWDTRSATLLDVVTDRSTIPHLMAGLPPHGWDFYGANETIPPMDGDGYAVWLSPLNGIPVVITGKAVLFSFVFALHGDKALVDVRDVITHDYPLRTVVYGTDIPGLPVTGELGFCIVRSPRRRP